MDVERYIETLRSRLAATSLPVRSRRLQELFDSLLTCGPEEKDQVAGLVASVVATLTNPHRRMAMWERIASITALEWRQLAAQKACQAATRRHSRPKPTPSDRPHELSSQQEAEVATALLGTTAYAIQGGGHLQLELERIAQEGLVSETSPSWSLLERLRTALRSAEREHVEAVEPLTHLAGQVLTVVTDYPERITELMSASDALLPDQLRALAVRLREARHAAAQQIDEVIKRLGLVVDQAEDVEVIALRLTEREAVGWGDEERRVAARIQLHLRQGEELWGDEGARPGLCKVRQGRARRRASELLAHLLIVKGKTPIWWKRVVQAGLREIELDSLSAKRIKASRQRTLVAKALEAVETASNHTSSERFMPDEIAAELGRSLGQLEFELRQRPGDEALKTRIAQTRELREHFLGKQREDARARLAQITEEARGLAAEGELKTESGEWFFDMT
ncbi:MAG TPA: hypothetical protein DEA08_22150 [Planctomycetes bacterium]|nr:hypothetical protein [Planctomycetota bacterium]